MGRTFTKSATLGFFLATALFAADPFVGVWTLNPAQSKNAIPAANPQSGKVIYEAAGPDSYRITREAPNGATKILAWMDGKDYSNDSDGKDFEKDSALPAGTGTFTIAWQRIDDLHQLQIFRKSGKEYSRRETSVSADGMVLTVHQWGLGRNNGQPFDNTRVYDKTQ
jgi:hypothetical protein